jgi:hypothetical protein
MTADMRLVQLARMLAVPRADLTTESARALIAERPDEVADALFHEAADSDDVTGNGTALDYLEGRLASFGDLVSPGAVEAIGAAFRERIKAWEASAG